MSESERYYQRVLRTERRALWVCHIKLQWQRLRGRLGFPASDDTMMRLLDERDHLRYAIEEHTLCLMAARREIQTSFLAWSDGATDDA